jgi:hypothetical protein
MDGCDTRPYALGPLGRGRARPDYGCGEGLHADLIATPAAQLTLCEAASSLLTGLSRRFSGNPRSFPWAQVKRVELKNMHGTK